MTSSGPALDVAAIRQDFPILRQSMNGHRLAYLDNAASTQRPSVVIDAISTYYSRDHANVHRGVHTLSQRATDAQEAAREIVRQFIGAADRREIIFTRGTTDSVNLVAGTLGQSIGPGDEILITHMEHHSNIVPWQMLCERTGARLVVAPIDSRGELLMGDFLERLGPRTRLVSIVHVSNALGTVLPVEQLAAEAKRRGIPVLIDGAQAVAHTRIDVRALGCDFYAFSGHKMYGPTGIGVLYGRLDRLERLPPYQGGGEMILSVSFEKTEWNELPYKFEAGTPHIAGIVGLGAAITYLESLDMNAVASHESLVLDYGRRALEAIDGLTLVGTAKHKAGVLSFVVDGIHSHDLGTVLDHQGVAVRTGHHCAMPLMSFLGLSGTARASLAVYNDRDDIDQLVEAIRIAIKLLGR
ncbi:MAG: cysteine desulfurase [Gammaproteobacteria bacterium]|nr:cysteine desulfurase [Gammaproteobacteria bacterium]